MGWVFGVATAPAAAERRVALVPELVDRYRAAGARVVMARGAAARAHWRDEAFRGVEFVNDSEEVFAAADVVACVMPPTDAEIRALREGTVLVGALRPWEQRERVELLARGRVTALALELLPRVTRAQPMDILSSQATVAGYEAALIAADHAPKFFPMLTYAAGTIRPARVLVIGCGVAGLQAIATARRLGALVEAYDVRPETREQVLSLGAKFVETGVTAVGEGGYARELTSEEQEQQARALAKAVAAADVVITTASVPGRPAPRIVTAEMLAAMRPGAVVVDLAAEQGGNVEGSVAGEKRWVGEVLVIAPTFITSRMPIHASEMFAKNVWNFLAPYLADGAVRWDWEDEVLRACVVTHEGSVVHQRVREWLGL
ncbi:MAG: NAD(P) transhydrogenase subunit alpha [Hydrogenophilus sp.]|nr:NAD(P) transhydrogenase subunit alpha [Hydrogenophilus sp.]